MVRAPQKRAVLTAITMMVHAHQKQVALMAIMLMIGLDKNTDVNFFDFILSSLNQVLGSDSLN